MVPAMRGFTATVRYSEVRTDANRPSNTDAQMEILRAQMADVHSLVPDCSE